MGKERTPHVGRPFGTEVTEHQVNDLFQTTGNVRAMDVKWPLLIESTQAGGIRLSIDPEVFEADQPQVETIWPVVVRDVRDDNDHFIWVQDVVRDDADPWVGGMKPSGEAYEISIWAHGKARDFRALITRETIFTRATPIVSAILAIGQPWVLQYLRFDLIQPRDQIAYTDCTTGFTEGR